MTKQIHSTKAGSEVKSRWTLVKFLAIVLPLWLSAKFFNGPYMNFIRDYFAAIILIILFSLLYQLLDPKRPAKPLLIILFVVLSSIELLYSIMPSLLTWINVSIGNTTLIGGNYSINFIPYYGVGAFIGYFILRTCRA